MPNLESDYFPNMHSEFSLPDLPCYLQPLTSSFLSLSIDAAAICSLIAARSFKTLLRRDLYLSAAASTLSLSAWCCAGEIIAGVDQRGCRGAVAAMSLSLPRTDCPLRWKDEMWIMAAATLLLAKIILLLHVMNKIARNCVGSKEDVVFAGFSFLS